MPPIPKYEDFINKIVDTKTNCTLFNYLFFFFFFIQSISNCHGWFDVGASHCHYFVHKENFACIFCFLAIPQVPLSPSPCANLWSYSRQGQALIHRMN